MQGLAGDVYALIPYVYNREAFFDIHNRNEIQTHLERLAKDTHKISPKMGKEFLGNDPLLEFSLTSLKQDLNRALESFETRHLDYSRNTLKTAIGHCFRCHSVVKVGSAAQWKLGEISKLQLAPAEKIDLLVAGRKYEEALEVSEDLIKNKELMQNRPFEYEDVLKKYVTLVARWDQKPKKALEPLNWVEEQKNLPTYLRLQVKSWINSLSDWAKDKKPLDAFSSKQLIAMAEKAMNQAEAAKEFARDRAGDVEYLRASTYLHEALRKEITETNRGKALYLLGQVYEVLDELGAWNLHEVYYEQCIRQFPATQRAHQCYNRLEASVYFGYSGSSGIHLPAYERVRLQELKGIAGL